jgi:hypothetical protein
MHWLVPHIASVCYACIWHLLSQAVSQTDNAASAATVLCIVMYEVGVVAAAAGLALLLAAVLLLLQGELHTKLPVACSSKHGLLSG